MRNRAPDAYLTIAVNLTMDVDEANELLHTLSGYPDDHPTTPIYMALDTALDRVPEIADDE